MDIPGTVDGLGAKFHINQETMDINQSFFIEAPTMNEISGFSEDLPSCPNAYNMTASAAKIYFKSDDSVEEVSNFFSEGLFGKAWEISDEKGSVSQPPVFSSYAKEDENLVVIFDKGQNGSESQGWIVRFIP